MRDPQVTRVYLWEDRFARRPLSFARCEALVHEIHDDYGLPEPTVFEGEDDERIAYWYPSGDILLPPPCRSRPYVFHECAHGITVARHGIVQSHGPEFVRTLIDLYVCYAGMARARLEASAVKMGVRVA